MIEPSVGIERLFYALICNSYELEKIEENNFREVLKIPSYLAPYQVAVFPLVNKLNDNAKTIYQELLDNGFRVIFDTSGSIGKRYRRMDAIGTPFCVTVDFETISEQKITIRERDSMKQTRIFLKDLTKTLAVKLK